MIPFHLWGDVNHHDPSGRHVIVCWDVWVHRDDETPGVRVSSAFADDPRPGFAVEVGNDCITDFSEGEWPSG